MDDTMLSPFFKLPTLRTDQLITLPFLFCGLWLFGVCFWFVCFWFVCFVCVFSVGIVTAYWTMYWSYFSSTFEAHLCKMDDVFA